VLEIEIYNDNLDIAAILTKNDEIIKSVDIEKEGFSEIVEMVLRLPFSSNKGRL
jgi:hypothetical protein